MYSNTCGGQLFVKKILIDLEGVLNEYTEYDENSIPKPKDSAEKFLKELSKNAELHLFTTRNALLALRWLIKHGLDKYFKNITNVKIPAYLYIDDRCICFDGNFEKLLSQIKTFKVYWKNN